MTSIALPGSQVHSDIDTKRQGRRLRRDLIVLAGGYIMKIKKTIVTSFAVGLLLASSIAVTAFAQEDSPAGTWNGTLEQGGTQKPLAIQLTDEGGVWRGRFQVDGASSTMEKLSVDGNHVRFVLDGQGVFDAVLS